MDGRIDVNFGHEIIWTGGLVVWHSQLRGARTWWGLHRPWRSVELVCGTPAGAVDSTGMGVWGSLDHRDGRIEFVHGRSVDIPWPTNQGDPHVCPVLGAQRRLESRLLPVASGVACPCSHLGSFCGGGQFGNPNSSSTLPQAPKNPALVAMVHCTLRGVVAHCHIAQRLFSDGVTGLETSCGRPRMGDFA